MSKIDLDAARAARREVEHEALTVALGGRDFVLPSELPFVVVERLADLKTTQEAGDNSEVVKIILSIVELLLGDMYTDFMAQAPSMADLEVLLTELMKAYGFEDLGEAPASDS